MQKGVFLYICFIHCNSQLYISEYIYMYNKNKRSNEIYKTRLIMHVFKTCSTLLKCMQGPSTQPLSTVLELH